MSVFKTALSRLGKIARLLLGAVRSAFTPHAVTVWVFIGGIGCLCGGVFVLHGFGWSLVVAGVSLIVCGFALARGLSRVAR